MPYCLKCDMEFVEGITACSDCGQPLIDTEEALRIKEEAKQKKENEAICSRQRSMESYTKSQEGEYDEERTIDESPSSRTAAKADVKTYVPKRRRYEDMKSSVSAFLLMGGIFGAFAVLCLMGIISLPLSKNSSLVFNIAIAALTAFCLTVAITTKKSSVQMLKEADIEEARTKELITWFLNTFDGTGLDGILLKEDPNPDENELYLRRFELIQDRLVTSWDLPDPSYVDYLSEELYKSLYEQ